MNYIVLNAETELAIIKTLQSITSNNNIFLNTLLLMASTQVYVRIDTLMKQLRILSTASYPLKLAFM
nr:hypothetical protein KV8917_350059 [Klebsiella variicola]